MDNLNNTELTPPAIPEVDVAQQVANEMLGVESTALAAPEDPVEAVLRENGYANLPNNNTVIQREGSILVVPENNENTGRYSTGADYAEDAQVEELTAEEYVSEVNVSEDSEGTPAQLALTGPTTEESSESTAENALRFANVPEPTEEQLNQLAELREEFEREMEEAAESSSFSTTTDAEQERIDEETESQEIDVDEVLHNTNSAMELAIASAMEGAETVANEAPVEISKADLLTMLPVNSKSFEIRESTSRFSGASWYNDVTEQTVIIAGQGGIGSWATMIMSRMHPRQLFIYDDDTVETVNLAGQLYGKSMVGKKKVNAMANLIKDFSDYNTTMAIAQKWTGETQPGDIMICGFDNMQARKTFFHSWLRRVVGHPHPEKCLFIDGRLAFTDMQIFCITGDDSYNIKRYNKEYLFTDSEADATICSMKQTTYCASIIGGLIVNLFTNFIANLQVPFSHDLPFKTFYDSNMFYLKTES